MPGPPKRFGPSSKKAPFQGDILDEVELEVVLGDVEDQLQALEKPARKSTRNKREGFPVKLQRIRVDLPLSDEE